LGERHCYVLPRTHNEGTAAKLRFRFGKDFHVSPFLPMDMSYDWRFTPPDGRLLVHMENWREGSMQFDATMTLDRTPITGPRSPAPCCAIRCCRSSDGGHLLAGLQAVLKRVPFHTHPDNTGAGHRARDGRIERLANEAQHRSDHRRSASHGRGTALQQLGRDCSWPSWPGCAKAS